MLTLNQTLTRSFGEVLDKKRTVDEPNMGRRVRLIDGM